VAMKLKAQMRDKTWQCHNGTFQVASSEKRITLTAPAILSSW
jgi:hypothetical protein